MRIKPYLFAFIHWFLKFILGLIIVTLILGILSLILTWQNWKQVGQKALYGQAQLQEGISSLQIKDFQSGQIHLKEAETSFSASKEALQNLRQNWLPAKLAIGRNQLNHLESLNSSALIISRSALQANNLALNLSAATFKQNQDFQSLSLEQKSTFIQSLIALEPELNGLKANINLALIKLESIPHFSILWPIRNELKDIKDKLASGENLLKKSIPLIKLLPVFSGYPNGNHYLIMLQNNDELRPTGGFLGSYVRLDIANFGEISKLEASDIYHLDMPAIGKTSFQAPDPITNYLKVENWYLRDANWSPDWPTSARQIQEMFYAESEAGGATEPKLDAIIGITPNFVANLIRLTGPITVRGETYAPENMQALLQYNVEVGYKEDDISSWDRKDIINELIAELKNRLSSLPLSRYSELFDHISDSLEKKDVLVYFNKPEQQTVIESLKGGGEINRNHDDYFMVIDANLAAFKSDAVVNKNIFYKLQSTNKDLKSTIKLNYTHTGGFDWRTTRYRSYTRILAPLGSQFINIEGLKNEETDVSSYEDVNLNKQVFAFFWTIEPGKNREVSINYYLPKQLEEKIKTEKEYNLFVQRQPGSRIESLSIGIDSGKAIIDIMPKTDKSEIRLQSAYWTSPLDKDQEFKVILK